MGKTPKKAPAGGDESNLYVRRLKATTTAPSKLCDTSSTVKQRESENPNRGKIIGGQKRLAGPAGKVFKSKLRSPARTKTHGTLKNPPRFQPPSTSKDERKPAQATSKDHDTISTVPTMQPDSDESAVQLKKEAKDVGRIDVTDVARTKEDTETSHSNTNGKASIELAEAENPTPRDVKEKTEAEDDKTTDKPAPEEISVEPRDNGNDNGEVIKINDADNPTIECEDDALKLEDEGESPKKSDQNGDSHEFTKNIEDKKIVEENTESTESKKIPDNCSVDVVESTTSEASDSGNATQSEKETNDNEKDNANSDATFVSYDSSIMLKDVQIKLNDCLKDNSKLFDVSHADESSINADEQKRHDMSFGKTLRNISGRSTINRLRYVTVREQRFSPNSSLFVNTSSASLDQDDPAGCKLTRYPTDLSDSVICNGTPAERKRKIVSDAIESAKKLKIEAAERTGLLNSSLEMLKSIRRPVQVSTPNTKGYDFKSDRYESKAFGDEKLIVDSDVEPKKWCVVM